MSGKKTTATRLRHRLMLQQEVLVSDGAGGLNRSWADVVSLWAEIIPLAAQGRNGSLDERYYAGQMQAECTHKIVLRYRAGVTAAMRLVFDSRLFSIRRVINRDESNEVLELLVQEGAGD